MEKSENSLLLDAENGDANAQFAIARQYERQRQYKNAEHWYLLAAQQGHTEAMYEVASMYDESNGNDAKALEWYLKVVETPLYDGCSKEVRDKAYEDIACFYKEGRGCEKNLDEALKYYKLGAEAGIRYCGENAGDILKSKGNEAEAFKYYKLETEPSPHCYLQLATMYEKGIGTEVDMHLAKDCYRRIVDTADYDSKEFSIANSKLGNLDHSHTGRVFFFFPTKYSKDEFWNYFEETFPKDLASFFVIQDKTDSPDIKFVPFCAAKLNPQREGIENDFYFTIALFYTALLPQAVGVVCGENVMKHFHKISSAPWINCGLHGLASPIMILKESDLLINLLYSNGLRFLIDLKHSMKQLLDSYLRGEKTTPYTDSLEIIKSEALPRIDEIWSVCEQHIEDLRLHLLNPSDQYPMKLFNDDMQ